MLHMLLAIIYLAFISLGLPGLPAGIGLAFYVPCARRSCILCRRDLHDHLCRHHSVKPPELTA